MLKQVGRNLEALFDHIPSVVLFSEKLDLPEELAYKDLKENYSKSRQRIKGIQLSWRWLLDLEPSSMWSLFARFVI